ncbi:unnamed protein product [Spirodela intermedia]|uniref:Uncharacterized protein n=1 Tax=Spirodela intermedia TaxID=51605 RepID=A0A7I8IZR8_SPIIN|nr:unnamed protein product [Spirodela intermedia]CAA6663456.1 unnamed protein product [Spirodela intermedia]
MNKETRRGRQKQKQRGREKGKRGR